MGPLRSPLGRWAGVAVLAACLGCGGAASSGPSNLVPVAGKVTINGRPVPGGQVMFCAPNARAVDPSPVGEIGPDGTYALKTGDQDGAAPGKYQVVVSSESGKDLKGADPAIGNPDLTPLTVEVGPDRPADGYDLKLDSRAKKGR
jgi:hypothetical protein